MDITGATKVDIYASFVTLSIGFAEHYEYNEPFTMEEIGQLTEWMTRMAANMAKIFDITPEQALAIFDDIAALWAAPTAEGRRNAADLIVAYRGAEVDGL